MPQCPEIALNNPPLRYGGFSQRLAAECGTPLLAGGLCAAGYEEQSRDDLLKLSCIKFNKDDDIYDIDFRLAQAVRLCCGKYVFAVGVSAALPDIPYATGGVIGSPHMEAASADSCVRDIGNGLYVRAFPGGPGCVAAVRREVLECWDYDLHPPENRVNALAGHLRDYGAGAFIIVSDGSGPSAEGVFIIETGGVQIMHQHVSE